MSRFDKLAAGALLSFSLSLSACVPQKGTASPEDYFPLIQIALAGGEAAAMIGRNEALDAKNFEGCVASAVLITAFDSSSHVLAGRLRDQIIIPAVDIDVSECLALHEGSDIAEPHEEGAALHGPVVMSSMVAGYAPESEDTTAPAPTEPVVEEPVVEEPVVEEPPTPAEEPAALQGHPDAAVLVETFGGITLAAVLHYATKLQAVNCKKGTAAIGVLNYVGGMLQPVAEEIADPDGKVSIPSVTIDLSACEED